MDDETSTSNGTSAEPASSDRGSRRQGTGQVARRLSPVAAATIVFTTSAAVLVLEILAGRLLAPYVGVTLETWTGIIGTILAGISLGSWWGGRLADRRDPRDLLGPLIVGGGILALLAGPIVDFLAAGIRGARPDVIVLLAFMGFFAPAAVLSAVTPTVVKMRLADLDETGRVVGRLSALGTAGAIFGTFVTGFLFVATLPTRPILRILGITLVAGGLGVWTWLRSWRDVPAATVIVALAAATLSLAAVGPCEVESAYFCARIEVDDENPSGRELWLDTALNSYIDLEDPTNLPLTYSQTMSDVLATVAPAGEPLTVTHIGGGGLTLPRYLRAVRPGTQSLVLELDPTLIEIAKEDLGYVPSDDIEIRTGDARLTFEDVAPGTQEVVIGDAFSGLTVPWHLTTVEFLELIEERLTPDGLYAMNLVDYGPLGFARAEGATLREVFDHVVLLAPPARIAGDRGGNFIYVASNAPIDVESILARNAARGDDEEAATADRLDAFVDDAPILRDDFAPVDQLLTPLPPRRNG